MKEKFVVPGENELRPCSINPDHGFLCHNEIFPVRDDIGCVEMHYYGRMD
jgi:hypothetical protein